MDQLLFIYSKDLFLIWFSLFLILSSFLLIPALLEDIMSSLTKLGALRASLRRLRLDAFIIGSADAHQSEYVCDRDLRRAYLSDFTGSSGTALVLEDKALLWTDGRYFLQVGTLNKQIDMTRLCN